MITKEIVEREFEDLNKFSELNYTSHNKSTPTYIKIIRRHDITRFEYLTLSFNLMDDRILIKKGSYYYSNINERPTTVYEGLISNEYFFNTLIENLSNNHD